MSSSSDDDTWWELVLWDIAGAGVIQCGCQEKGPSPHQWRQHDQGLLGWISLKNENERETSLRQETLAAQSFVGRACVAVSLIPRYMQEEGSIKHSEVMITEM